MLREFEGRVQSSAANDDHQHHDEDPEDIELDLGSACWNEALQQLRWSCVNCDRSVFDYECGLQKLQRGAKLDQSIKEAAVAVSNVGSMDMKLYKAWTGQTKVKPGVMPPPLPCQHDVATTTIPSSNCLLAVLSARCDSTSSG